MSDSETDLSLASPADLTCVMSGLAGLAADLGDPFRATSDVVRNALFGEERFAFAILARQGDKVSGLVFCSPSLSTVQGRVSVYVSDLWVAQHMRGQALGQRLLMAAITEARNRWEAGSLRLLVYAENNGAIRFYRKLGFDFRDAEKTAVLTGAALSDFMGEAA